MARMLTYWPATGKLESQGSVGYMPTLRSYLGWPALTFYHPHVQLHILLQQLEVVGEDSGLLEHGFVPRVGSEPEALVHPSLLQHLSGATAGEHRPRADAGRKVAALTASVTRRHP